MTNRVRYNQAELEYKVHHDASIMQGKVHELQTVINSLPSELKEA